MKCYLFSIYDMFREEDPCQNEFLDKHLSIKDFLGDDITFVTFNHDLSRHPIIRKNRIKTLKLDTIYDFPIDGDFYMTFGNFISFPFNAEYYSVDGDLSKIKELPRNVYWQVYITINNIIKENKLKIHQYMSDPMDVKFDTSIVLTPDSKVIEGEEYFPLYQYFHGKVKKLDIDKEFLEMQYSTIFTCMESNKKEYDFIVGSTCYSEFRMNEFNHYLLPLYTKEVDNPNYKFYISGYGNRFYSINNFIDHNEFYDEIEKSKFGLVLGTYSQDVISANKISQFLSKRCIPLLTRKCDSKSKLIPDELKEKYTVENGHDLINKLDSINYNEAIKEWMDFYNTMNRETSKNIINNYITNIGVDLK